MSDSIATARQEFVKQVHDAYNRLYDTPYLRTHSLVELLLPPEARLPSNRSQNLRRVLLDAIETLKPHTGMPAQSPDWRYYRIFELRYVEGLAANETMEQLAISKSQFFRDHAEGLEHIAAVLWDKRVAAEPTTVEQSVTLETERLFASATWEIISVMQVLTEMQTVVAALARIHPVQVEYADLESLVVRADRVILRQALLNLITFVISNTSDTTVRLTRHSSENETGLFISFRVKPVSEPPTSNSGLQLCAKLMTAVNGRFAIREESEECSITLAWREFPTRTLLIVDDNAGLHDLYRRYLAEQNWHVIGAKNGKEARELLLETLPTVILLDVMMPEEDGWELLVSFKGTPELAGIPVIICSVVNEPKLAADLGAASSLTKPVSQQSLVEALAPWS
ncbi:MAG: response regulator [Chloroflexota bacterium]